MMHSQKEEMHVEAPYPAEVTKKPSKAPNTEPKTTETTPLPPQGQAHQRVDQAWAVVVFGMVWLAFSRQEYLKRHLCSTLQLAVLASFDPPPRLCLTQTHITNHIHYR
jgi:cell division septation protein DedD